MNSIKKLFFVFFVSWCLPLLLFLPACQKISKIAAPHDPAAAAEHARLGATYEQAGDWPAAEREYRQATRLDDKNAPAWLGLGNVHRALGRPGSAVKSYEKAHELSPGDAEMLNRLARGYLELGKLEPALSAADQAVALDGPGLPYYLDTRGRIKLRLGDRAGAAQDLRAALLQAPEGADTLRREIAEHLQETEAAP